MSPHRINFDLHRAGGLWLWVLLLIFAWSSVYMNLGAVYTTVTRLAFDYRNPWTDLPLREKPLEQAALNWRVAESVGRELMARAGAAQGFSVESPVSFRIDRAHGVYIYHVHSSLDFQDRYGETRLFFDADTGERRLLSLPSGQYAGNTVTAWLFALHKANVFGLSYRILVCLLGVAIVMLSVTGVIIWLRKRQARRHRRRSL
ncbi:PepSY-associated TM helix domain-containing protein [Methylococcus sp. EFPC2]|uniref:PepSY-associated TM helix domain-containing protein n=1 Tax=Methylococcus sp. EFPC2 TaxID=2812648 RepID=UPI001968704C|nr:PepSY-associated TM helix domain-containing protein [Methylococcus sp. EFPC2]QSA96566.1 PepSY domain-containing protein [Methylococcus sp. EFPC2]